MMKKQIRIFLLAFLIVFLSRSALADIKNLELTINDLNAIIKEEIKSPFSFSGLAGFYNKVNAYIVDNESVKNVDEEHIYNLSPNQTLALIGHQKILIIKNINTSLTFKKDKIVLQQTENNDQNFIEKIYVQILLKSDLKDLSKNFEKLKYVHLWEPLKSLCIYIEIIFLWLNSLHFFGWGTTIILFSLLFKIFILPVNILLLNIQKKVFKIQADLEPELENIKLNFKGEKAHYKFMAAHKEKGVTPFYNLKPLLLTFMPIPFFIAIFNVLGELDLIAGHSFLWIKNLAYPDAIFYFGANIPLLGESINLLPFLMTLLTISGAYFHQNKIISSKQLNKQKLNLYFMALGFLILFYPFPSAMVLYWTFANFWSILQQKFIKV